ncbi:MAG: hypothetical protein AB7O66_16985 [Limisphaerales bacterium]
MKNGGPRNPGGGDNNKNRPLHGIPELKADGAGLSGELSEGMAKQLLTLRRPTAENRGPEVRNAKGSATFWIQDGVLSKYQYKVSGTMSFGGEDRDVERTTTVEISGIGSTKVDAPEAAKKKLG